MECPPGVRHAPHVGRLLHRGPRQHEASEHEGLAHRGLAVGLDVLGQDLAQLDDRVADVVGHAREVVPVVVEGIWFRARQRLLDGRVRDRRRLGSRRSRGSRRRLGGCRCHRWRRLDRSRRSLDGWRRRRRVEAPVCHAAVGAMREPRDRSDQRRLRAHKEADAEPRPARALRRRWLRRRHLRGRRAPLGAHEGLDLGARRQHRRLVLLAGLAHRQLPLLLLRVFGEGVANAKGPGCTFAHPPNGPHRGRCRKTLHASVCCPQAYSCNNGGTWTLA